MGRTKVLEIDEIKQSNYITTARYNYSPMQKRILYRIVEKAWEFRLANAQWFKENGERMEVKKHVELTMPITAFMTEEQIEDKGGKSYEYVIEAFKSLVLDKKISSVGKDEFSFGSILNYADRNKGEGTITFSVHKYVWQSALDFTRGFTKLDLKIAMQFKSAYTMRFFEFAKEWQDLGCFTISVQDFREMFCCTNKYPLIHDLKRYIIKVANDELDKKCYLSFDFVCNKVGREIRSFTFIFKENKKIKSVEIVEKELLDSHPSAAIPNEIKSWIMNKLDIDKKQLYSNIKTFYELYKCFGDSTINELEETFQYIVHVQGKRPQTNVGLVIANLKSKITNEKKKK